MSLGSAQLPLGGALSVSAGQLGQVRCVQTQSPCVHVQSLQPSGVFCCAPSVQMGGGVDASLMEPTRALSPLHAAAKNPSAREPHAERCRIDRIIRWPPSFLSSIR
jgi:hypothetical protein